MHVVVASHYYPPHVGGIEVVAQAQVEALRARGHAVTVLTSDSLDGGGRAASSSSPGLTVKRLRTNDAFQRRVGIPFPLPGPRFLLAAWRAVRQADIVHIHDVFYLAGQLTALCALVLRRPLFLTQHVGLVDSPVRLVRVAQRLCYVTIGRFLFRRARVVVVYNPTVRRVVEHYGGPHVRLEQMRNGVDTDTFAPVSGAERRKLRQQLGWPTDRPVVLFVGRLVAKKGAEVVVSAARPDYLTVLVGGGRLAVPTAVVDDVRLLGSLPREELPQVFQASDVFVLPTLDEPFTLALQEALASALPVVTTPDPAYDASWLEGMVVVPRTADALAAELVALVSDADRRRALANSARQLALDHFSWHVNVTRLVDLYAEVGLSGS